MEKPDSSPEGIILGEFLFLLSTPDRKTDRYAARETH